MLLAVAAALLADQLGFQVPGSAWGLLLAIPAISAAIACVRSARLEGTTSRTIIQGLLSVTFLALAAAIAFSVDLGLLWPAVLLVLAVLIIVKGQAKAG